MGLMIEAACSCGYHASTLLGGGMDNFDRECPTPFHCPSCRAVVTADLLAKAHTCPDCGHRGIVPYTDPTLAGEPGTREVAECNYFSEEGIPDALINGLQDAERFLELADRLATQNPPQS